MINDYENGIIDETVGFYIEDQVGKENIEFEINRIEELLN